MIEIIRHRINKISQIETLKQTNGAEIDVRSDSTGKLFLSHDAVYEEVDELRSWLAKWGPNRGTLILNVKEEGLEELCEREMAIAKISNWFFLDQSFPFLMKSANRNQRRCAVRVSEYESIMTALNLAGQIDWVWLDCFTKSWWPINEVSTLQKIGYRVCVVSPELQGETDETKINDFYFKAEFAKVDAICTKVNR
jgi:hypothetical protein